MKKFPTLRTIWPLMAAIILLVSTAPAADSDLAFLRDTWRPDPDAVIAVASDRAISELDVYLWQLIVSADPLIVKDWQEAITAGRTNQLRDIERAVRQIIEYRALAQLPEGRKALSADTLAKGTRIYAAPGAKYVLTDELIMLSLEISPIDIAHYYRTHESEFLRPAEVDVRRLRIPFPENMTETARQEIFRTAQSLRQRAVSQGGLLPLLREYPEYQLDRPVDGLKTVTATGSEVDPRVRERIFELATAEISTPIQTPNGLLLVEIVERRAGKAQPITDVQDQIREKLRAQFLPQQYQYQLAEASAKAHPINRAARFPYMDDEAEILRVRQFFLNKGEYADLFPERVLAEGRVPGALFPHVQEIVTGEVITQRLEEMVLEREEAYRIAKEMGRDLTLAAQALRVRRALVQPTDEQITKYLMAHRSELLPEPQVTLWRIDVAPRNEDSIRASALRNLTPQMMSYLREQLTVAEQQLSERAAITGDSIYATPSVVLRRVPQPEDSRLRLRYNKLEAMEGSAVKRDFGLDPQSLRAGVFTDPRAQADGTVSAFYIERIDMPPSLDNDQLRARASLDFILETAREPGVAAVRQMDQSGALKWNIPVEGVYNTP
ncbi:peptidyl-prolyl cis-trans isomerase [bacterium]|nr:peptidyl-prolyl cis-trans isomerase [bacterium]